MKCADVLTISGLNLCQEACEVREGKKIIFLDPPCYHISGDRDKDKVKAVL